jgi:hypothetical protein
MKPMTLERTRSERRRSDTMRRLCELGMSEPAGIWEMLESEGIDVTPGVIYQAISNHNTQQNEDWGVRALLDKARGVSLRDVERLVLIAEKAGGIRQLIRLLSTMHRVANQ